MVLLSCNQKSEVKRAAQRTTYTGRPVVLAYLLQCSGTACYKGTDKTLDGDNQLLIQLSLVPWKLRKSFPLRQVDRSPVEKFEKYCRTVLLNEAFPFHSAGMME